MKRVMVAIDGPAGAGKSTLAKKCAAALGYIYIDTGAMYRAAALYAILNGIEITAEALVGELDNIKIDIAYSEGTQRIFLNGKDVSERIREADVSRGASDIARIPEVRIKLVEMQRKMAADGGVIMDGRDIGTYVLPNAEVKIYLTASVDERARRRAEQMRQAGMTVDLDEVKRDIIYRDENDKNREFAPLKQAEDAVLLDTTKMSFEESEEALLKIIKAAL